LSVLSRRNLRREQRTALVGIFLTVTYILVVTHYSEYELTR
jgi:hypothetical protein